MSEARDRSIAAGPPLGLDGGTARNLKPRIRASHSMFITALGNALEMSLES